jgi:hypothetical protein
VVHDFLCPNVVGFDLAGNCRVGRLQVLHFLGSRIDFQWIAFAVSALLLPTADEIEICP